MLKLVLIVETHSTISLDWRSWQQGCQPVFTKKVRPCPKQSQTAVLKHYTHKICVTKHKIDIQTCQKHQYNTIPLLEAFSFPIITLLCICFLSIALIILGNSLFNILCTLHGYRFFSEKICNEYTAQTMFFQSQVFPTEKKLNFVWLFFISRKIKASFQKKPEFQIWLQNWQPCLVVRIECRVTFFRLWIHFCFDLKNWNINSC